MPRTARASAGGVCYHVLNRGNGRAEVFHKDADFDAFVDLLGEANKRLPVDLFAYVLMPNHFHLVLRPTGDGDLGRWMQWFMTAHVRRYHRHYHSSGHVWQGRFKAFPIQEDAHLLTVIRYVERNPLRAKLVKQAEAWRWSSLHWRSQTRRRPDLLAPWPVRCPPRWIDRVNASQSETELEALGRSVTRGRPFGDERWTTRIAHRLDLQSTIRPRGRPKAVK